MSDHHKCTPFKSPSADAAYLLMELLLIGEGTASLRPHETGIRLPETIPNSRLATLAPPSLGEMLRGFGPRFMLQVMNPRSHISRALNMNPGTGIYQDAEHIYARNLEVPSGNGVGTARAIARVYSVFAAGGRELGLRQETLDLFAAPAIPPTRGFYDECLKADGVQFLLGFMKPSTVWPFGSASAFGAAGQCLWVCCVFPDPAKAAVLTVEFKTNLIAPAKGEQFVFRAHVLKPGRTITVCDARAFALDRNRVERLVAAMTGTLMAVYDREGVRQ